MYRFCFRHWRSEDLTVKVRVSFLDFFIFILENIKAVPASVVNYYMSFISIFFIYSIYILFPPELVSKSPGAPERSSTQTLQWHSLISFIQQGNYKLELHNRCNVNKLMSFCSLSVQWESGSIRLVLSLNLSHEHSTSPFLAGLCRLTAEHCVLFGHWWVLPTYRLCMILRRWLLVRPCENYV